jgi:hypothetical protein
LLFVDEDGAQPKLAALTAKGNKSRTRTIAWLRKSVNTMLKKRFCTNPFP